MTIPPKVLIIGGGTSSATTSGTAVDVLGGVHNIMAGNTTPLATRTHWIASLAGPGARVGHICLHIITHGAANFRDDPSGHTRRSALGLEEASPLSPALGFADAEYFEHLSQGVGPAKETSDWDAAYPR
ncbi:hypothetical protein BGZ52_010979, partial [Haplosporangium bisporale]